MWVDFYYIILFITIGFLKSQHNIYEYCRINFVVFFTVLDRFLKCFDGSYYVILHSECSKKYIDFIILFLLIPSMKIFSGKRNAWKSSCVHLGLLSLVSCLSRLFSIFSKFSLSVKNITDNRQLYLSKFLQAFRIVLIM